MAAEEGPPEWEDPRNATFQPVLEKGTFAFLKELGSTKEKLSYVDWYVEKNTEIWVTLFGIISLILAITGLVGFTQDFPDRSKSFFLCSPTDTTEVNELNLCYEGIPKGNLTAGGPCDSSTGANDPNAACGCYVHWAAYDFSRPSIPAFQISIAMFSLDLVCCFVAIAGIWIDTKAERENKEWAIKMQPTWGKGAWWLDVITLPVVTILTLTLVVLFITSEKETYTVPKNIAVIPAIGANSDESPDLDLDLAAQFQTIKIADLPCVTELSREAGNLPEGFAEDKDCKKVKAITLFMPYERNREGAMANPDRWIAVPSPDQLNDGDNDDPMTVEDCTTNKDFTENINGGLRENVEVGVPMLIMTWIAFILDYEYCRRRGKKHKKEMKNQWKAQQDAVPPQPAVSV